jgi:hypothetical protein
MDDCDLPTGNAGLHLVAVRATLFFRFQQPLVADRLAFGGVGMDLGAIHVNGLGLSGHATSVSQFSLP